MEQFDSLKEAQVVIEAWRDEYNSFKPHSALGYHPFYFLMPPKVNPSHHSKIDAFLRQSQAI